MPAQNALGPMVRIKDVRTSHGLTLKQLSDRIAEHGVSISESGLSNIENGNKRASDHLLVAWAKALNTDPMNVWQGPLRPAVTPGVPKAKSA